MRDLRRDRRLGELEALYRDRYRAFFRVARAILGDDELAADAVHDAFVNAVRSRRSFRGEGSLEAWVWRAVVNAAKRRLRRPAEPALRPAPFADDEPGDDAVRAALARLPERQRLVLFLRYYADLDYRSIAEVAHIAPGTVAATLNAARASIRQSLQEVSS